MQWRHLVGITLITGVVLMVTGVVLMVTSVLPAQPSAPRIIVDGQPIAGEVILQGGRVYVPIRFVSEALGAGVRWDPATRTVTVSRAAAMPGVQSELVTFFYVANQTGADVRVRVWADGRLLFERTLPSTAAPQPGVVPPPPPYPAAELKVALPRNARTLEVEEDVALKLRRSFTISGFDRAGMGFRITLTRARGIEVTQDYQPIR